MCWALVGGPARSPEASGRARQQWLRGHLPQLDRGHAGLGGPAHGIGPSQEHPLALLPCPFQASLCQALHNSSAPHWGSRHPNYCVHLCVGGGARPLDKFVNGGAAILLVQMRRAGITWAKSSIVTQHAGITLQVEALQGAEGPPAWAGPLPAPQAPRPGGPPARQPAGAKWHQ